MENVAAIESAYGGGNHSHLGLVINPASYCQESGQNFAVPLHPPPTPYMPRQFMLQQEMDSIHQDHKAAITCYYTALNVDKTFKKQLVETIYPMYVSALRQPILGLTNIACL
eukprot:7381880-Ditylum_brightwellii.AAC.3